MGTILYRVINFTLLILAFLGEKARAEDYALVIGGSSKKVELKQHEFARNTAAATIGLQAKGYKVTTLFGSERDDQEKEKYSSDFEKIKSLQRNNAIGRSRAATDSNIDAVFKALIAKVKSGDKIEVLLSAHGADSCELLGSLIKSDFGSQCTHTFTVFNSEGSEIQYPTAKILNFLKKLEDKGALPSLLLNSCHSGRAKNLFKKLDFKNTCAFFQTAGNELGFGCFEDDPEFATDYTSTSEYVVMRYYKASLSKLEKDPYFAKSHCFQKTMKHYREAKLKLSSISTAYWSARNKDSTFQSPALSTLLNFSYFTTGLIQPQITKEQNLSSRQMQMSNDSLIRHLTNLGAQLSDDITAPYNKALNEYNEAVYTLKKEIDKKLPETPEHLIQIATLQRQVKNKADTFISKERKLIDQLFKNQNETPDPCTRPL